MSAPNDSRLVGPRALGQVDAQPVFEEQPRDDDAHDSVQVVLTTQGVLHVRGEFAQGGVPRTGECVDNDRRFTPEIHGAVGLESLARHLKVAVQRVEGLDLTAQPFDRPQVRVQLLNNLPLRLITALLAVQLHDQPSAVAELNELCTVRALAGEVCADPARKLSVGQHAAHARCGQVLKEVELMRCR